MAKTNIEVRNGKCLEDYYIWYVIQLFYFITSKRSLILFLVINFIHIENCWNFRFCLNEVNTFLIPFD